MFRIKKIKIFFMFRQHSTILITRGIVTIRDDGVTSAQCGCEESVFCRAVSKN